MSLRYADRYPATEQTPQCFGRTAYYSSRDQDCQRCSFFNECGDEIRSRRSTITTRSPARTTSSDTPPHEVERYNSGDAGVIREGETAAQRFLRDCLTGACRGGLYEGYRFFNKFRF